MCIAIFLFYICMYVGSGSSKTVRVTALAHQPVIPGLSCPSVLHFVASSPRHTVGPNQEYPLSSLKSTSFRSSSTAQVSIILVNCPLAGSGHPSRVGPSKDGKATPTKPVLAQQSATPQSPRQASIAQASRPHG